MDPKTMAGELKEKYTAYWFTIAKSVVCVPSFLIAAACFAPSRYESKLWDLKHYMDELPRAQDGEHAHAQFLTKELTRLRCVYHALTSKPFFQYLKTMKEPHRLEQFPRKYIYYTRSSIDWELIRIQPLRYLWNETDQLALYGLGVTIVFGSTKYSPQIVYDSSPWKWARNTDTAKLLRRVREWHTQKKTSSGASGYYGIVCRFPSRIKYPIAFANAFNMGWILHYYQAFDRIEEHEKMSGRG